MSREEGGVGEGEGAKFLPKVPMVFKDFRLKPLREIFDVDLCLELKTGGEEGEVGRLK